MIDSISTGDSKPPDRQVSRRSVAITALVGLGAAAFPIGEARAAGAIGGKTVYASDFGVVANGVTNDAPALASAVAAMTNGSVLILPAGTIALGSAGWPGISISGFSDIRIIGNATIIKWLAAPSQSTGPSFPTGLRISNCDRAAVVDITFDGNNIACAGLGLNACTNTIVSRCGAHSHSGSGQFVAAAGTGNTWDACRAWSSSPSTGTRGFWLGDSNVGYGESDLTIRNCVAKQNSGSGIVLQAVRVLCVGNRSVSNVGSGIISSTATGNPADDHSIVGNICSANSFHGYQTDVYGPSVQRLSLIANEFFDNLTSGIYLVSASHTLISDNNLRNNGPYYEILVYMSSGVTIADNFLQGSSVAGTCISTAQAPNTCADLSIVGNRCIGSVHRTIDIYSGDSTCAVRRVSICNNLVSGGSFGISLRAASAAAVLDAVVVSGNIVSGATSAGFAIEDSSVGQTTGLRVIGNAGSASVSANSRPQLNYGNAWNRVVSYGTAAPTSGSWSQGDVVYHSAPAASGFLGWVCTASGIPGSWKTFGAISA
jgi:hypothetical protein